MDFLSLDSVGFDLGRRRLTARGSGAHACKEAGDSTRGVAATDTPVSDPKRVAASSSRRDRHRFLLLLARWRIHRACAASTTSARHYVAHHSPLDGFTSPLVGVPASEGLPRPADHVPDRASRGRASSRVLARGEHDWRGGWVGGRGERVGDARERRGGRRARGHEGAWAAKSGGGGGGSAGETVERERRGTRAI